MVVEGQNAGEGRKEPVVDTMNQRPASVGGSERRNDRAFLRTAQGLIAAALRKVSRMAGKGCLQPGGFWRDAITRDHPRATGKGGKRTQATSIEAKSLLTSRQRPAAQWLGPAGTNLAEKIRT